MHVEPHAGAGVEIRGVDLRALDEDQFARVHDAFKQHGLLFFRDQELTPEDHIAFASRFGPVNVNRFFPHLASHPEVALVVKEADQRTNVGGAWHTDHSYDVEPALGSVLVARELPASGGDTHFVSMYDAFESLPARVRHMLRGMHAVHSAKYVFGAKGAPIRKLLGFDQEVYGSDEADAMPDVTHPVVIRHPLSGREALYVNPGFTIRLEGRSIATSLPLLAYLYANALRPRHVAKFRWEPGSVAVWDNRATWHYAKNDYAGQRREMHRITIDGGPLAPARPNG